MKKILVPYDFSAASENALNYAIELAGYFSADLKLLHVSVYPIISPEMNIASFSFEEMKQDGLEALKKVAQKITASFNTLNVECYSDLGEVSETINDYAKKLNAYLTVMGISDQDSSFIKALVGSNAVDVSKKISSPLLVVPQQCRYHKVQNVAYASDYDERIEEGAALIRVKYAVTLFNSLLHVLHVIPENHALTPKEAAVDDYIEHQLKNATHKTYLINDKKVSNAIIKFVNTNKIDLLMVEPKNNSIFHSSVSKEILFRSPVPVLVIHNSPA